MHDSAGVRGTRRVAAHGANLAPSVVVQISGQMAKQCFNRRSLWMEEERANEQSNNAAGFVIESQEDNSAELRSWGRRARRPMHGLLRRVLVVGSFLNCGSYDPRRLARDWTKHGPPCLMRGGWRDAPK